MAKFGYIMLYPGIDQTEVDADIKRMEELGCVEVVQEEMPMKESSRTLWDSLTARLRSGDVIVLSKLSNALRGARQLVFFLEFCRVQNVRLISLRDKIDSGNELFPETRTSDVLTAIALLPKESNAVRNSTRHLVKVQRHISDLSHKAVTKAERNKQVVNMYLQGISIDDIFAASGFRSRSSVFRILNEANVDLNRGRTKGPLGPRKKSDDNNTENQKR